MKKSIFVVVVALAVLAAAACQNNPTGPNNNFRAPATVNTGSTKSSTVINIADLVGTWQATKAEGSSSLKPGVTRDLVAEGGTVTLFLEMGDVNTPANWPRYSVTVAMPGAQPGVDTGRWVYSQYSIDLGYSQYPQIDFYPASLGPDPEYGWIPAFQVSLSEDKNTLKLWDSGLTFLPYDFGWGTTPGMNGTVLTLDFARK